jgi:hypothetical protein
MVGRGTRLHPGKEDCVILDVCDLYKKCSLVTLPSLLGLNPLLDLHGGSIIEAAETLEAAQDKYPGVDFTNLADITKVKAFIESIDLFAEPYAAEIKELTKLAWMSSTDGSYVLQIPEAIELSRQYARYLHEKLWVKQNQLEEWVLSITSVSTDKELGVYNTLKEAFESADEVMQRCRPSRMKLVLREAEWHAQPATEPAKKLLRTLTKNKPILKCLCPGSQSATICPTCRLATGITAGEASTAINLLKARKGK